MSRRFRESHSLRVLGFSPVTASRFFPAAGTLDGCYSPEIRLPAGGDIDDEAAAPIASRLELAIDTLIGLAAHVEPVGVDLPLPD